MKSSLTVRLHKQSAVQKELGRAQAGCARRRDLQDVSFSLYVRIQEVSEAVVWRMYESCSPGGCRLLVCLLSSASL